MPTCTILLGKESNAVHKIAFLIGSLQLDSNEVLFHCLFSFLNISSKKKSMLYEELLLAYAQLPATS